MTWPDYSRFWEKDIKLNFKFNRDLSEEANMEEIYAVFPNPCQYSSCRIVDQLKTFQEAFRAIQ